MPHRFFVFIYPVALCVTLCLCACAGAKPADDESSYELKPFVPYMPRDNNEAFTIIDYQNKNTGGTVPRWLNVWKTRGPDAVEKLPAYSGKYCFVMEQRARELDVLLRWMLAFKIERNFRFMAQRRIHRVWTRDLTRSPDLLYGRFYENLLRACSRSEWTGSETERFFWVKARVDETQEERYSIFVLASMEKSAFQAELESIYRSIPVEKTDTRAQAAAVLEARATFWQRFDE